ncbi:MAG: hypothetical protein AAF558_13065 [Verrucomicrobiota bacterium]
MRLVFLGVAGITLMFSILSSSALSQTQAIQDSDRALWRSKLQDNPFGSRLNEEGEDLSVDYLSSDELEDAGPQYLLLTAPRRQWVQAYFDSQYFYTSNVFQQEEPGGDEAVDTGVLVSTAQLAIAPDAFEISPRVKLAPQVGYQHQWFNYGLDKTSNSLNNLDFDSQMVFTELGVIIDENWTIDFGFEWTRLLGHETSDNYAEFYKEYRPRWSIERRIPLEENMLVRLRYEGSYRITEVDPTIITGGNIHRNDRHDHAFTFIYSYMPIDRFIVQPFLRYQLTQYTENPNQERTDHLFSGGLSLSYYFTSWIGTRAFFNYINQQSDDTQVADYEKWDGGGGLSVFLKF